MRKYIFITAICTIALFLSTLTAFASGYMGQPNGMQQANTEVTYSVDGTYMIEIPESVVAGNDIEIRATEVNIADDKQIDINLDNLESGSCLQLTNATDESAKLTVYFYDVNHQPLSNHVGSFTNNSQGQSLIFSSEINPSMESKAGTYSGVLNFSICCF